MENVTGTDADCLNLNCDTKYFLSNPVNASVTEHILNFWSTFGLEQNISNGSTNEIPNQPRAPVYIVVTATLFYIAIFVFGVLGNILVMFVIGFGRAMRTSVNIFLLNLCIADLLVMFVCMPTALTEIFSMEEWYFGAFMCKSCCTFQFMGKGYTSQTQFDNVCGFHVYAKGRKQCCKHHYCLWRVSIKP